MEKSESDDEGSIEGEGTAKQKKSDDNARARDERRNSPDWRSSLSQSRLSSLFGGWVSESPTTTPSRSSAVFAPDLVSEPKLVGRIPRGAEGARVESPNPGDLDIEEPDSAEFEKMLVCLPRPKCL